MNTIDNVAATCVSNSRTLVARRFLPAKVACVVISFCLEQSIGRQVLNTSIPPLANHHPLSPSSSIHAASNLGGSDLCCPLLDLSLSLSLSLSLPSAFLSYLRYVLSGLASPLHLFPSSFDMPFASSCHRFLLPPVSYKDAQETCLSLHPAMGCHDRSRRRLQALAFQHVAACVQAGRAYRNTASFVFHDLLLGPLSLSLHRLIPSPPRRACPFKRILVAKFSPLTLPPEYSTLGRTAVTRNNFVDYTPLRNRFASWILQRSRNKTNSVLYLNMNNARYNNNYDNFSCNYSYHYFTKRIYNHYSTLIIVINYVG